MANKTIKESIRDLFLGLGGDATALADNNGFHILHRNGLSLLPLPLLLPC